jgi:hypothetical protein
VHRHTSRFSALTRYIWRPLCLLVTHGGLGGRIWADASPLEGTRIAFELPPAPAEVPASASQDHALELESRVA